MIHPIGSDSARSSGRVYGTSVLLLPITAIMVAVSITGVARFQTMLDALALQSSTWSWQDPLSYSRLFSYVLLHGSAGHFIGNCVLLLVVGSVVEWRLGFKAVVGLFVLGAAVAALTHLLMFPTEPRAVIGASGAISALLGAAVIVAGDMGLRVRLPGSRHWFALTLRRMLLLWLVLQLIGLSQLVSPGAGGVSIAYWVHIAGFATGVAWALVFRPLATQSAGETSEPATRPLFAGAGD